MSIASKLKIDNKEIFAIFIFYAAVAVASFVMLPIASFPPHIGIIGMLNLIAAYGLLTKRTWAIWFVVMLFFIATVFTIYNLYALFGKDLIVDITMIAYLILTWVSTTYIAAKRKILES